MRLRPLACEQNGAVPHSPEAAHRHFAETYHTQFTASRQAARTKADDRSVVPGLDREEPAPIAGTSTKRHTWIQIACLIVPRTSCSAAGTQIQIACSHAARNWTRPNGRYPPVVFSPAEAHVMPLRLRDTGYAFWAERKLSTWTLSCTMITRGWYPHLWVGQPCC